MKQSYDPRLIPVVEYLAAQGWPDTMDEAVVKEVVNALKETGWRIVKDRGDNAVAYVIDEEL